MAASAPVPAGGPLGAIGANPKAAGRFKPYSHCYRKKGAGQTFCGIFARATGRVHGARAAGTVLANDMPRATGRASQFGPSAWKQLPPPIRRLARRRASPLIAGVRRLKSP